LETGCVYTAPRPRPSNGSVRDGRRQLTRRRRPRDQIATTMVASDARTLTAPADSLRRPQRRARIRRLVPGGRRHYLRSAAMEKPVIVRGRLIDHVHLVVTDLPARRRFYEAARGGLGLETGGEGPRRVRAPRLFAP